MDDMHDEPFPARAGEDPGGEGGDQRGHADDKGRKSKD